MPNEQNKLLLLLVICSSLSIPLFPMDLDPDAVPLLEEPLLEEPLNPHAVELEEIVIDAQQYPSPIWDGSRRYYDTEAKRKVVLPKIKTCVKAGIVTVLTSLIAGPGLYYGLRTGAALFLYIRGGTFSFADYFAITDDLPFPLAQMIGCSALAFVSTGLPSFLGLQPWIDKRNLFEKYRCSCSLCPIDGLNIVSLPEELITQADESKVAWRTNERIRTHLSKVRRSDAQTKEVVQKIEERLALSSRENYARTAYSFRRFLLSKLPQELVAIIWKNFSNPNIIRHMIPANKPAIFDGREIHYVTEKEILSLISTPRALDTLLDSRDIGGAYHIAAHLAQYGWIAFKSDEKYPIRCRTRYFDPLHLSAIAKKVYAPDYENEMTPTFYLPYHPDIARFYKFEQDPHYAREHQEPSNPKIRKLLTLRSIVLEQDAALAQMQALEGLDA